MDIGIFKISGVALSGLALALALLKFQLVTEVAKKLTSDEGLAKKTHDGLRARPLAKA